MEVIRKYFDRIINRNNDNNNDNNCNCKTKINCPLNVLYNLNNVVYQAIIFTKENIKDEKIYIGTSLVRWKLRLNNHIHLFSLECLKIRQLYPNIFGS